MNAGFVAPPKSSAACIIAPRSRKNNRSHFLNVMSRVMPALFTSTWTRPHLDGDRFHARRRRLEIGDVASQVSPAGQTTEIIYWSLAPPTRKKLRLHRSTLCWYWVRVIPKQNPKTAVQVTVIEESDALRDVRDAGSFAQHRLGTRQSQQKLKAMR
jgi:hypothetical protein